MAMLRVRTPGKDYGLYLDNYDTSVIGYNTVTM